MYILDAAPPDVEEGVIRAILEQIAGPEGREDVMNAGEQLRAQGRAEGEAKALRANIATLLSKRGVPLSERAQDKVAACVDVATLNRWFSRAVTAASEAEVFADDAY
jgi:hypothetical protein